jgi:two-component system nitrate/nitrite response regulator NarL
MKVLVCDDHQLLAEALASVLRRRGDVVTVTTNPQQAVSAAVDTGPDVVLMDRSFPDGDGILAVRELLEGAPATRVIMLSGHTDPVSVRAALDAGARGFLRKDAALGLIMEAVDAVVRGELVIDPLLLRTPTRPPSALVNPLTAREQEVLQRIVEGQSTQSMAPAMNVSYSTARTHTQNLLMKLGVHTQLEAAAFAVRHGLVEPFEGDGRVTGHGLSVAGKPIPRPRPSPEV